MTRIVRAAGPLLLAVLLAISGLTTFTYSQAPQTPTPSTAPPVTPAAIVGNVIGGSWNPAGTLLAAWRTDGSLTIEDRGGVVRVHLDHENPIRSFSWSSADANVFVYIPIYGSAHVVKVTELGYEVIGQYSMAGGRLREAQLDAVGVRLALINSGEFGYPTQSRLEVRDVNTGALVFDYGSDYMSFIDIAWDPAVQSRLLLSEVDEWGTILRLFDVTSQTEIWSHEIPEGGPTTVVWNPDGTTFVTASTAIPHALVAVHDSGTGETLRNLDADIVSDWADLYWPPDMTLVLRGRIYTQDEIAYGIWDQDVQQIVDVVPQSSCSISSWPCTMPTATAMPADAQSMRIPSYGIGTIDYSPDGSLMAAGGSEGVAIWDSDTGLPIRALDGPRNGVSGLAWSPDGTRLVAINPASTIYVWDTSTWSIIFELTDTPYRTYFFDVDWNPEGTEIVVSGDLANVSIFDPTTGEVRRLVAHSEPVAAADWSPDGEYILSGDWHGQLVLWDAASGDLLDRFSAKDAHHIGAIDWDPNSRVAAVGSTDGVIRLWDPLSSTEVLQVQGHAADVFGVVALAWTLDGTYLVSSGGDGTIRVWDNNLRLVQEFEVGGISWDVAIHPVSGEIAYVPSTSVVTEIAQVKISASTPTPLPTAGNP